VVESRLVSAKNSIEHELRLAAHQPIDPKRRRFLTAKLLQLERDISALGFSAEEIEHNDFSYSGDKKEIQKQTLVTPPSWTTKERTSPPENVSGATMKYREEQFAKVRLRENYIDEVSKLDRKEQKDA
jgi:hypothetical protein